LAVFLSHPRQRVMTYRPGGAHPTGYFRVLILAEMLRRMGFARDAAELSRVWHTLYQVRPTDRLPPGLLARAPQMARSIVDETAYQTRRNLAQHALADVIPFGQADEDAIKAASRRIAEGSLSQIELPPRHLVSAATYALNREGGPPHAVSRRVINHLAALHGAPAKHLTAARLALAA
jgi:hypothetical protein